MTQGYDNAAQVGGPLTTLVRAAQGNEAMSTVGM
jgi:hypothetical protein